MAAAIDVLRGAFAGISPRERRLIFSLAAVLGLLAFVGVFIWTSSSLDDIETERAATLDALRTIRNERPRIRQRQSVRDRTLARYATRAPALTSFVEQAAHDPNTPVDATSADGGTGTAAAAPPASTTPAANTAGVDAGPPPPALPRSVAVAEATDRTSPVATGSRFQRRAVSIRVRQVDLQSLVNFMDRIDAATFPVAITGIRIRKRFGESNSFDVDDMVIATWDRLDSGPRRVAPATATGSAAGASGGGVRSTDDTLLGGRR